ncbi:MAG: hypothetical protein AAGA92_04800 [Planctomycetota bacterium]
MPIRLIHRFCLFTATSVCLASLAGCGTSGESDSEHSHGHEHDHDHGHSHRPESLHEAVAELESLSEAIRTAIVDGDPKDAHDPLHEIGYLLEAIPDVAAETDLPEEEWNAVKAASEQLFDAFAEIDKTYHVEDGDKQAVYEDVSAGVDEAIEEIRSRLPLTGEKPDASDHDHSDHDHDGHSHDDGHDHGSGDEGEASGSDERAEDSE